MQRREALQRLAALAGVRALAVRSADDLWAGALIPRGRLAVLSPSQDLTVVALAERIIPATDTPGATAARVNEFIDLLLAEWFTAAERDEFLAGLDAVDARTGASLGKAFAAATVEEQDSIVAALDDEAYKSPPTARPDAGRFFERFKALTLYGYYNSEVGMTQELRYEIIPNRYAPCAPRGAG